MLLLCLKPVLKFRRVWTLLALVSLNLLLLPGLSKAAEWSLQGSLDQSLSYDDNVFMRPDNFVPPQDDKDQSRDSFQYRIIPVLTFMHKTDVSDIHADVLYGGQIFTDIPELDQKIQNYGLGSVYKTESFDWGVDANLSITPSRNTALQNSGIFNTNSDRTNWSVSPFVSYKIDEINTLTLTSSYSETTFSNINTDTTDTDEFNNNFNNNDSTEIDLAWKRDWSERYNSALSLFYSNFNSQLLRQNNSGALNPISFDSVGINFSNTYSWSENWNLLGTVGGRYTESTSNGSNSSSFGFLADVAVSYTGENFISGINFSRSLIPSNQGQLQEQTSVGLNFNYDILETLSAGLTTSYVHSTLINESNSQTRENIIVQPSASWQLLPEWTLSGGYRYRIQDLKETNVINGSGFADSNLFYLSINYNWQGIKLKGSSWN